MLAEMSKGEPGVEKLNLALSRMTKGIDQFFKVSMYYSFDFVCRSKKAKF